MKSECAGVLPIPNSSLNPKFELLSPDFHGVTQLIQNGFRYE